MIRSRLLLLSACLIATQLAGCTTMGSWRSSNSKSIHSAKSKSSPEATSDSDTSDTEDEEEGDDDRLKYFGDDGRAELVVEEPLDPWFGKYNYADKGRAIERNLGSGN